MDGTAHSVIQLYIDLGKHVSIGDTCFRDALDSSSLYDLLKDNLPNGLALVTHQVPFLQRTFLHMAVALFGMTIVSSFLLSWSQDFKNKTKHNIKKKTKTKQILSLA